MPRTTHSYRPRCLQRAIEVKRHQLPLAINFASTVHRVQGDTVHRVLVDLRTPVFTHGQLYTALSRVLSRVGLRLLVAEADLDGACVRVKNIVRKELLRFATTS